MSCVYILTNNINGKKYIGQTTKLFDERLKNHIKSARTKNKSPIHRALNKYGIGNFQTYHFNCEIEDLDYLETELIKIFNSVKTGYNCETGGNKNKIISEETRKKNSDAQKGHVPWNKGKRGLQKAWNKGLKTGPLKDKTKKKMSISQKKCYKHRKKDKWNRFVSETA